VLQSFNGADLTDALATFQRDYLDVVVLLPEKRLAVVGETKMFASRKLKVFSSLRTLPDSPLSVA
jgi:hypothetical protein